MVECNILQCSDTAVSSPKHWCYTDLCLIQLSVMLHSALCSYPLKLGSPKFLKVKAQFSLNFVPNFKILVLTG